MADFVVTITIPDANRADFLNAYAVRFNWVDQETSGTKAAFARDKIREIVKQPYRAWKRDRAIAAIVIPDDGITAV